jgi:hypothetical protein
MNLSPASLRAMIPPAAGWPSVRRQCRLAATIAKQTGAPYAGTIGDHRFTVSNGNFAQPCTAGAVYCHSIAAAFQALAMGERDPIAKRMLLGHAARWRKDAAFRGWRLP